MDKLLGDTGYQSKVYELSEAVYPHLFNQGVVKIVELVFTEAGNFGVPSYNYLGTYWLLLFSTKEAFQTFCDLHARFGKRHKEDEKRIYKVDGFYLSHPYRFSPFSVNSFRRFLTKQGLIGDGVTGIYKMFLSCKKPELTEKILIDIDKFERKSIGHAFLYQSFWAKHEKFLERDKDVIALGYYDFPYSTNCLRWKNSVGTIIQRPYIYSFSADFIREGTTKDNAFNNLLQSLGLIDETRGKAYLDQKKNEISEMIKAWYSESVGRTEAFSFIRRSPFSPNLHFCLYEREFGADVDKAKIFLEYYGRSISMTLMMLGIGREGKFQHRSIFGENTYYDRIAFSGDPRDLNSICIFAYPEYPRYDSCLTLLDRSPTNYREAELAFVFLILLIVQMPYDLTHLKAESLRVMKCGFLLPSVSDAMANGVSNPVEDLRTKINIGSFYDLFSPVLSKEFKEALMGHLSTIERIKKMFTVIADDKMRYDFQRNDFSGILAWAGGYFSGSTKEMQQVSNLMYKGDMFYSNYFPEGIQSEFLEEFGVDMPF